MKLLSIAFLRISTLGFLFEFVIHSIFLAFPAPISTDISFLRFEFVFHEIFYLIAYIGLFNIRILSLTHKNTICAIRVYCCETFATLSFYLFFLLLLLLWMTRIPMLFHWRYGRNQYVFIYYRDSVLVNPNEVEWKNGDSPHWRYHISIMDKSLL